MVTDGKMIIYQSTMSGTQTFRSPVILTFSSFSKLVQISRCCLPSLKDGLQGGFCQENFLFIRLKGRILQCILHSKNPQKHWAVNASFSKWAREPECTQSAAPVNTGWWVFVIPWSCYAFLTIFVIPRVIGVRHHPHCYYCCLEKVRDILLNYNPYLCTYSKS